MFLSSDQKSVELMSAHVRDVYNYHFSQQTNNSLVGQIFELPIEYTPMHADDVAFLVSSEDAVDLTNFSDEEKSASRNLIRYWTNFAKHGNPSPLEAGDYPAWVPVTPTQKNYMDLKSTPEMKQDLNAERMYFWDKWFGRKKKQLLRKSNYDQN
eukprot:TRINITY_DN9187_c0_g1_i1.p1 TRINITY_DN9187_c0_g1~~TRINITY_DN9187_c0_g1_i1.p1  ORF type:complete len:154 (-),score=49.73 TRINITY_DN9187_c0_g1_i1:92-553(-)